MYLRVTKHVFLHIGLLAMASLSFFAPQPLHFWRVFLFALWHEGCHLAAAQVFRVPVLRLNMMPYGLELRLGYMAEKREVLVVLAGPCGSLAAAAVCALFGYSEGAYVNLLLAAFNLLPALPLDGGRLLRLWLAHRFGFIRTARAMRRIGQAVGMCLLAAGIVLHSWTILSVGGAVLAVSCA